MRNSVIFSAQTPKSDTAPADQGHSNALYRVHHGHADRSEEFVRTVNGLGMPVHIEISFTFERYSEGSRVNLKKNILADRQLCIA